MLSSIANFSNRSIQIIYRLSYDSAGNIRWIGWYTSHLPERSRHTERFDHLRMLPVDKMNQERRVAARKGSPKAYGAVGVDKK